jgi:hypothetical protein
MNDSQAEILLDKLVTLISIRSPLRVWCTMSRQAYNEVIGEEFRELCGSPYKICAGFCILQAKLWAQSHAHDEPMEFIFEKGTEHEDEVADAFNRAQKYHAVGGLFVNDGFGFKPKKLAPLQAADLLAWGARRAVRKGTRLEDTPFRKCFSKLFKQQYKKLELNKSRLERLLEMEKANADKREG